jgi:hypothetical protein
MGKNSAVGMTLQLHGKNEEYLFLDRNECESLLSETIEFQRFLARNSIHKIIYLMVDRTTKVIEVTESKINYTLPILIAGVISKIEDISFVWPSSIFCEDKIMVEKNPYLLSQNLAFQVITDTGIKSNKNIARMFLPQIYGSENYRKHQPFLYKVRDLIRSQNDVILTNGKSTFRNFIHEYDVYRVIDDSKNWISQNEVKCLFEENLSWFEIAEMIKKSYKSESKIFDQTSHSAGIPEYRYFDSDTLNVSKQYNLSSFDRAIEMGLF